jgi:chemotaxis protein histidine kinase CheA
MCSVEVMMSRSVSAMTESIATAVMSWCAKRYDLDGVSGLEELMRELNITVTMPSKKEKSEKKEKVESLKSAFPLPFNGIHDESKCQALRQNNGLYTQCQSSRKEGIAFCKPCQRLADKSSDGIPEYGTIDMRMVADVYGYTDPKGRKPIAYAKVMKKFNLTRDDVTSEAERFGIKVLDIHFDTPIESKRGRPATKSKEVKESKGAKGRPKKAVKVLQIENDSDDLFANLVADANIDDESVMSDISTNSSKNQENKTAKLQAKSEEKAAKEAEKQAKLQAKAEEKAAKEAEKQAKLQAKLQAKAEEKAAKEAEKQAAKEAEKQAKLQAKAEEKAAKEASKSIKKVVEKTDVQEEVLKVTKDAAGKKYLRSPVTNIVYQHEAYTQNEELIKVGMWNAEAKTIIFDNTEDSDSELEEEEEEEEEE